MPPRRRFSLLLLAFALLVLALPSSASAQATRTWVSGVGDDVNPCSRTAPCKTFGTTQSKTAAGGEINIIDAGGFGAVTITKSLTIRARGFTGGILASSVNGVIINAGVNDKVTLDGLDINGSGTTLGLNGVRVLQAKAVNIVNSDIYRFSGAGVIVQSTAPTTKVRLRNNDIFDNGVGLIHVPGNASITSSTVTARHNTISDNFCGVVTGAFGANSSSPIASRDCGTNGFTASGPNEDVVTRLFRNGIEDNEFGVFGRGLNAVTEIARNEITGNAQFGLRRKEQAIIRSTTPGSNVLSNADDEAANGTLTLG